MGWQTKNYWNLIFKDVLEISHSWMDQGMLESDLGIWENIPFACARLS